MIAPVRAFFQSLRADLVPTEGRWVSSVRVALACCVALGIDVALQGGSFAAPAVALFSLQPTAICTWRNLVNRLLLCAGTAVFFLPFGGVLVQLPWLLVPSVFFIVTAVMYVTPLAARPMESLAILLIVVSVLYVGVLNPSGMGASALQIACGYAVGAIVGTAFAQLFGGPRPHEKLFAALAASFAHSHARLSEITARYRASELDARPGAAPYTSELGRHLQLFEQARQEGVGHGSRRVLLGFMTAAERVNIFIDTLDALSREQVGRTYRQAIDPELGVLIDEILTALDAFAQAAKDGDALRPAQGESADWPDMIERVRAIEAHQLELRTPGVLARIGVEESANLNAFVRGLAGLAEVLHVAPAELARINVGQEEDERDAPLLPQHLDPYALRYAVHAGLATTLAFVWGVVSHVSLLLTALWTALFIAQWSYGATLRRAELRLGGVFLGGLLALLTIIVVFPNVTELPAFLVVFFFVILLAQYMTLGGVNTSYVGTSVAATYMMILAGIAPVMEVSAALWRGFAALLGVSSLFLVFRFVAPDYAGRQLVARFADLLRVALALLPGPGKPPVPLREGMALRRELGRAHADIVRLIEEARMEGHSSGVDLSGAMDAAGLGVRIVSRVGLISYSRRMVAQPPLSEPLQRQREDLLEILRVHLEAALRLVEARNTMARPGKPQHDAACRAAARAAAEIRALPDFVGPERKLAEELGRARFGELKTWSPEAGGHLFAELEHLRRIGTLLPSLHTALHRMVLPAQAETERAVVALATPSPAS